MRILTIASFATLLISTQYAPAKTCGDLFRPLSSTAGKFGSDNFHFNVDTESGMITFRDEDGSMTFSAPAQIQNHADIGAKNARLTTFSVIRPIPITGELVGYNFTYKAENGAMKFSRLGIGRIDTNPFVNYASSRMPFTAKTSGAKTTGAMGTDNLKFTVDLKTNRIRLVGEEMSFEGTATMEAQSSAPLSSQVWQRETYSLVRPRKLADGFDVYDFEFSIEKGTRKLVRVGRRVSEFDPNRPRNWEAVVKNLSEKDGTASGQIGDSKRSEEIENFIVDTRNRTVTIGDSGPLKVGIETETIGGQKYETFTVVRPYWWLTAIDFYAFTFAVNGNQRTLKHVFHNSRSVEFDNNAADAPFTLLSDTGRN